MSTTLTPWFPAKIKPARVGVYQVRNGILPEIDWYSYWNGRRWLWIDFTPQEAYERRGEKTSCSQRQEWRGLAEESKVTA